MIDQQVYIHHPVEVGREPPHFDAQVEQTGYAVGPGGQFVTGRYHDKMAQVQHTKALSNDINLAFSDRIMLLSTYDHVFKLKSIPGCTLAYFWAPRSRAAPMNRPQA